MSFCARSPYDVSGHVYRYPHLGRKFVVHAAVLAAAAALRRTHSTAPLLGGTPATLRQCAPAKPDLRKAAFLTFFRNSHRGMESLALPGGTSTFLDCARPSPLSLEDATPP